MTQVVVGAIGFLVGLAAVDLGIQGLKPGVALRPFVGSCHNCGHRRGWWRLECPECGANPGWRAAMPLVTTLAAVAFWQTVGSNALLVPYLAFLLLSAALVVTDIMDFRIVDRLNLPGTLTVAVLLALASFFTDVLPVDSKGWEPLVRALAGAAAYFAGSSLVFIAVRGRGFGAGDVKLSVQLGMMTAYLSWGVLGWAVFATAMIGGVLALGLIVAGRAGLKTELPYGPPMVLGAWWAIAAVGMGTIPVAS